MNTFKKSWAMLASLFCVISQANAMSVIDLRGIEFQAGMPTPASTLEDSVPAPATKSLEILQEAADTLRSYPNLTISIVGFTDNRECVGAAACTELSLRRARMVYEWLIINGVLSSQITSIQGLGDEPVDTNDGEGGRQRNRHVELRNTQFDRM